MRVFTLILIAGIIGLFAWGRHDSYKFVYGRTTAPSSSIVAAKPSGSVYTDIDKTLKLVAEQLIRKADVNGDGKTNCIDAAVLFYQYFPDKSKVCIEINCNPNVNLNFNHAFNCVKIDGVWKAIEPQAYYSGNKHYWMWAVWGNRYDNKYNKDETNHFIQYVR